MKNEKLINIYGNLNIHKPITYKVENENGKILFLPQGTELINNYNQLLITGLLNLFSNENVVRYEKQYKMTSPNDVSNFINVRFAQQLRSEIYNYYIISERYNMLLGVICNISHIGIKKYSPAVYNLIKKKSFLINNKLYQFDIKKSWMLEFYAKPDVWGSNMMRYYLTYMVDVHREQDYNYFFAVVRGDNDRSIGFLKAKGFVQISVNDFFDQDGRILMVLDLSDY